MTAQDEAVNNSELNENETSGKKSASHRKLQKDREDKWLGGKLNKLDNNNWLRYLIHLPHGMGAAWALFSYPAVGIGWLILIITYQYLEDWKIDDKSYIDMRGYMIGFAVVSIIKIVWKHPF